MTEEEFNKSALQKVSDALAKAVDEIETYKSQISTLQKEKEELIKSDSYQEYCFLMQKYNSVLASNTDLLEQVNYWELEYGKVVKYWYEKQEPNMAQLEFLMVKQRESKSLLSPL